MTEHEWLTCADPNEMLLWLHSQEYSGATRLFQPAGQRKLRLFACACCRRIWHLLTDDRSRRAVEVAERYADDLAARRELQRAMDAAEDANELAEDADLPDPEKFAAVGSTNAVCFAADDVGANPYTASEWAIYAVTGKPLADPEQETQRRAIFAREERWQADALRDLFGNPLDPVLLDPATLTPEVFHLASEIYDRRAFDRMPALAELLAQAGCTDGRILSHCREHPFHLPGCWLLDAIRTPDPGPTLRIFR